MENQLDNIFKVSFDDNSREHLKTISIWAKICAVCAFIGYAIALVSAFLGKTQSSTFGNESGLTTVSPFSKGSAIAGALVVAIIGIAINYFLYKFAVDTNEGVSNIDQQKLNDGLRNLKTYYKIFGIILIICLSIGVLAFIFGILFSLGNR